MMTGCYTYSTLQSARVLNTGQVEITPSFSSISIADDGESEHATSNIGAQLGIGVARNFNLRFRFEHMIMDDDISGFVDNYSFLSFGPKFGSEQGIVALSCPFGTFIGEMFEGNNTWLVIPTLHVTVPVNQVFEVNLSPRFLIFFEDNADNLIALNAGIGLSQDLSRWAIRPELGWLFNPGEEGHFFSMSVGLSFTVN
jgi:hypothetical protein